MARTKKGATDDGTGGSSPKAAAPKTAAKKVAVRKSAAKKAAPKQEAPKKAPAKKAAAPKAAMKKVAKPRSPREITVAQREAQIAEAAYLRAEALGFAGDPHEHWVRAEAEVDARLRRARTRIVG